jgi:hypothetical protein
MKTAVAPKEITWLGTDGSSLIYRVERRGKITYRTSRKLPTFTGQTADLHFDRAFNSVAVTGG